MVDAGTERGVQFVVGLGNPGSAYDGTRHNIGFALLDNLQRGVWREKGKALLGEAMVAGKAVILIKPQTFMNLSGEAVAPLAQFHKVGAPGIVVAHDDIDLPLGAVRLKQGGGDGGHNGLKSVTQHVGADYVRLRLGVGRPLPGVTEGPREVADWVLARFDRGERAVVDEQLKRAAEALELLAKEGLKAAQNRFNR
ncbi:MAG: hypothetical protein RL417_249 [Pseudomonadota bacterium]|jgi:PTH1 family peptidyl-tRNA hydrolase